jgi:hypothetical protein
LTAERAAEALKEEMDRLTAERAAEALKNAATVPSASVAPASVQWGQADADREKQASQERFDLRQAMCKSDATHRALGSKKKAKAKAEGAKPKVGKESAMSQMFGPRLMAAHPGAASSSTDGCPVPPQQRDVVEAINESADVGTVPGVAKIVPEEAKTGPDEAKIVPDEAKTGPDVAKIVADVAKTGPDEAMDETGPDVAKDETGPDVAKTGPDVAKTGPDEAMDETCADVAKTGPDEAMDETGPDVAKDETGPDVAKDETGPDEAMDETAPDVAKDETGPDVAKDETGPDVAKDETGPDVAKDETAPDVVKTGPDVVETGHGSPLRAATPAEMLTACRDAAVTMGDVVEIVAENTVKTAVAPEVVSSAAVDVPMTTEPGAAAETLAPVLPLTDAQVSRVFFITSVATHKP